MSGTVSGAAGQAFSEVVGSAIALGKVAPAFVEVVGKAPPAPAFAAQVYLEVVCQPPPLPARTALESNFPVGFRGWPPSAGRKAWRIAP